MNEYNDSMEPNDEVEMLLGSPLSIGEIYDVEMYQWKLETMNRCPNHFSIWKLFQLEELNCIFESRQCQFYMKKSNLVFGSFKIKSMVEYSFLFK